MYNSLVPTVGGLDFQCLLGPVQQDLPVATEAAKSKVCKQEIDRDFPPENVGLHLHTQSQTDPISAWSQSSIDPQTSHFIPSAVSFVPDLIPFFPRNGPPEVWFPDAAPPPPRPARRVFQCTPVRWNPMGSRAHLFIWRWTAWCCGSWPVKVRWGWTWPGSSGLGWSAAPAIGGSVSSRLSAPVRQTIDQRHFHFRFLNTYFYLSIHFLLKMLNI